MNWLIGILTFTFLLLQTQLWFGEGSKAEHAQLMSQIDQLKDSNDTLNTRNEILTEEVLDLKSGLDAIEERARSELGLIKDNETFVLMLPKSSSSLRQTNN